MRQTHRGLMHFKNLIKAIEENNYELKQEAILKLTAEPNEMAIEVLRKLITSDQEELTIKVKASKAIVATMNYMDTQARNENRSSALFKMTADHSEFLKKLQLDI